VCARMQEESELGANNSGCLGGGTTTVRSAVDVEFFSGVSRRCSDPAITQ
jgi:hypothetical protein